MQDFDDRLRVLRDLLNILGRDEADPQRRARTAWLAAGREAQQKQHNRNATL